MAKLSLSLSLVSPSSLVLSHEETAAPVSDVITVKDSDVGETLARRSGHDGVSCSLVRSESQSERQVIVTLLSDVTG